MLVVGAKGFAKEVLEVLSQNNQLENLVFYDDVNEIISAKLFNKFSILTSTTQAEEFFKNKTKQFTIGIGNPLLRKKIKKKFEDLGGKYTSTISSKAIIGSFGNVIETGCNIMSGTVITNDITIKEGCLINLNCTIGHDSVLEEFVELSPGVHISGNCNIGAYTSIGTNTSVLPKISIGKNVIIGAGSVITKDIPDNSVVVGVPGKIIKQNPTLSFE